MMPELRRSALVTEYVNYGRQIVTSAVFLVCVFEIHFCEKASVKIADNIFILLESVKSFLKAVRVFRVGGILLSCLLFTFVIGGILYIATAGVMVIFMESPMIPIGTIGEISWNNVGLVAGIPSYFAAFVFWWVKWSNLLRSATQECITQITGSRQGLVGLTVIICIGIFISILFMVYDKLTIDDYDRCIMIFQQQANPPDVTKEKIKLCDYFE
jgi:hypothetical protein